MERANSRRRKRVATDANSGMSIPPQSQVGPDTAVSPRPLKWSSWVYVALGFIVVSGFFLIGQLDKAPWKPGNLGSPVEKPQSQLEESIPGDIRQTLHPEDHAGRPATTLEYNWTVTKGIRYPDGVRKEVYLFNDQFPGETIEARSGDRIIVNVTNSLGNEGLAIHWHGLRLKGANHMDGAVGVTQKPIEPGHSFLYDFTVGEEEFGTFWYHGHEKTQRDDGLYGGLIVHRPWEQCNEKEKYDYEEEVLLLIGDWYHQPSTEVLAWYRNPGSFGNEPCPDSLLINGMGNFDCDMAVPARPLQCTSPENRSTLPTLPFRNGERYRLRLINVGSLAGFSLKIDNATFAPFQVDGGHEIRPAQAQGMGIVYPGERVDAVLQVDGFDGRRFLDVQMDDENFKYPNEALNPQQRFPIKALSNGTPSRNLGATEYEYYNLQAAVVDPLSNISWPEEPAKFVVYTTTLKLARYRNVPMGVMNRTSWQPQASPPEPLISLPRAQYDDNQLCPHIPLFQEDSTDTEGSRGWVEVVINNLDDGGHPFHLHGYSFYVVSVFPQPIPWSSEKPAMTRGGSGMYNYNPFAKVPQDSPAGEYNLVNPMMKDTVFVPRRGYAVIRFRADNEGIWMMHCHVGWHLGSGMAMSWEVS